MEMQYDEAKCQGDVRLRISCVKPSHPSVGRLEAPAYVFTSIYIHTYTYKSRYIHDLCVGWREAYACIHIYRSIYVHIQMHADDICTRSMYTRIERSTYIHTYTIYMYVCIQKDGGGLEGMRVCMLCN